MTIKAKMGSGSKNKTGANPKLMLNLNLQSVLLQSPIYSFVSSVTYHAYTINH